MKVPKPVPQLHQDLAAVVREVLDRSAVPLNVTKLRSALPGSYKVPAKLKDAFVDSLASEAGIYEWPGGKYWTRDHRSWAEPAMLASASMPVTAAKAIGAISKMYGKAAAEALLAELLTSGALLRVPLFGGAKAKVCSRIQDEAAFRAELDEARRVVEAGDRRLGSLPDGRASEAAVAEAWPLGSGTEVRHKLKIAPPLRPELDDQILNIIAELEPRKGLLVTAPRIYRALPDAAKSDIDNALIRLQDARRVILHSHSNPHSQPEDQLIAHLYVGACWRVEP